MIGVAAVSAEELERRHPKRLYFEVCNVAPRSARLIHTSDRADAFVGTWPVLAQFDCRHPGVGTESRPVLCPVGLPVVVDVPALAPWPCWRRCVRELQWASTSALARSAEYEVLDRVDLASRLKMDEWPTVLCVDALVAEGRAIYISI